MADNARPALYGARYTVAAAGRLDEPAAERVVAGGPPLRVGRRARARRRPAAARPRAISWRSRRPAPTAQSMASTYNAIPRLAAVLVDDGEARLLTRRETIAELLARDL